MIRRRMGRVMTQLIARATGPGLETDPAGLDPTDWPATRALAHKMLDEALGLIEGVGERPVWQAVPELVKQTLAEPLPDEPQGAEKAAAAAARLILPYPTGNIHPRFFGWVHGSGTAGGVIAEMLAAAMNSNAGGRDHGAIYVERQVIDWCKGLFGFPEGASGLLVGGTSMATIIALTVARNAALGPNARKLGLAAATAPLVAYTSSEAHSSVARACELLGLGSEALRSIAVDADYRLDPAALREAIRADKAAGGKPFAVIATAGTVNTGAIDPLAEIADICAAEGIWLHIDGAFAALAVLSDSLRPRLAGIERADSLAFDFHKWLHVPYDAGCVLVRDGDAHRTAFASRPTYLASQARGLAAGEPWPCDFGPELSRGFRALKVWFTLKEHGTRRLGAAIDNNCRLARLLGARAEADPRLELMVPVALNVVCLRMLAPGMTPDQHNRLNETIVAELQERGIAAPSTTRIGGRLVIRVNITNHRTRDADIDILLTALTAIGDELLAGWAVEPTTNAIAEADKSVSIPFACLAVLEAALARPEIAASCGCLTITAEGLSGHEFATSQHGALKLRPGGLLNAVATAVLIRHGAELLMLSRDRRPLGDLAGFAADALLAARTAGCYLASMPELERRQAERFLPPNLLAAYRRLAGPLTAADIAGLAGRQDDVIERVARLAGATPAAVKQLAHATAVRIEAVNRFAARLDFAPPAEHLLTHGGDARIKIDPKTGRNGYGSSARPTTGEISFSSSTASCVSSHAYASVEALRHRLLSSATSFDSELERIRSEILVRSGAASVGGVQLILTASGTDAELATLALSLAQDERPLTSIVISPEETGSGVPQATLGRHFSTETALGMVVKQGDAIPGLGTGHIRLVAIAIRELDGRARPLEAIRDEVLASIRDALGAGRRVLLHVLDAAKTGIGAPAIADVVTLAERFGPDIDVVVDACQARLGPEAVAAYLDRGWLVQLTGSKFWGGPPFSGALLVPLPFLARGGRLATPLKCLTGYMARNEWPGAFPVAREVLPDARNIGLLCRWQASLCEAERFGAVSPARGIDLTRGFMAAVADGLAAHSELLPVDGTPIDHAPICANDTWQNLRSIVPIIPTLAGHPVNLDEAKTLHRALARDVSESLAGCGLSNVELALAAKPCHVGQPVKLGTAAALRICASSRTLAAMSEPGGMVALTADLATVLAKLRLLLRNFETL